MAVSKRSSLALFVLTRILLILPMVLTLLTIIFVILHVIPGDPVRALMGRRTSESRIIEVRHELGLDKPVYLQYLDYLRGLATGDLGTSIRTRLPVLRMILQAFPATLEYAIPTIVLAIVIGLYLGAFSAVKKGTIVDALNRISTTLIFSLPLFWLGIMLQLLFGVGLGWLPISGRLDPRIELETRTGFNTIDSLLAGNMDAFYSTLLHMVLPVLTMMAWIACIINRVTRSEMLTILRQDYVTAARSRGLPGRVVVYKHALKNALVPVITVSGMFFAWLLGGTVIVEITFSIFGMGQLFVMSVLARDFPVIQGIIVFYVLIVAVISIVIDILYAYFDPRIRF